MSVISMDTIIDLLDKNFPPSINTYPKRKETLKKRINLIFNQIVTGFEGERRMELLEHLLEKVNSLTEDQEPLLAENEVDLILGNIVSFMERMEGGKRKSRKKSKSVNSRRKYRK